MRAGSDVPDLVQALHVMLCALSLAIANGSPALDASVAEMCQLCGADAERVEQLRQSAFALMLNKLVHEGHLRADGGAAMNAEQSRVESVPQRAVGLLSPAVAEHNIAALHTLYRSNCSVWSFDDAQLISEAGVSAGEATPARKLHASSGETEVVRRL